MKQGYRISKSFLTVVVILGVLLLVIGPISASYLQSTSGEENTATVIEMVNQVEAHPRPADGWRSATVGMMVYSGGQVRTGTASSAHLRLLEGIVRLAADTLFTVKESITRQGTLLTGLFLQEGRLWVHLTTEQLHEFTVEAGSAVAAVRDTRFSIKAADGQTFLSVAEGTVVLTAQGQSVTVAAGQQAVVEPGQPPSTPEPMGSEERMLWATEGETPELALPTSTPTPTSTVTPTPTPTSTPMLMPTSTVTLTPALSPTPTPTGTFMLTPATGDFGNVGEYYIADTFLGLYFDHPVTGKICDLQQPFSLQVGGQNPSGGQYDGDITFTPTDASSGSWEHTATSCIPGYACGKVSGSGVYQLVGVAEGKPVLMMPATTCTSEVKGYVAVYDWPAWQIELIPAQGDCLAD